MHGILLPYSLLWPPSAVAIQLQREVAFTQIQRPKKKKKKKPKIPRKATPTDRQHGGDGGGRRARQQRPPNPNTRNLCAVPTLLRTTCLAFLGVPKERCISWVVGRLARDEPRGKRGGDCFWNIRRTVRGTEYTGNCSLGSDFRDLCCTEYIRYNWKARGRARRGLMVSGIAWVHPHALAEYAIPGRQLFAYLLVATGWG